MEQQKESIRPDEEQAHHELKLVQLANQHKQEVLAARNQQERADVEAVNRRRVEKEDKIHADRIAQMDATTALQIDRDQNNLRLDQQRLQREQDLDLHKKELAAEYEAEQSNREANMRLERANVQATMRFELDMEEARREQALRAVQQSNLARLNHQKELLTVAAKFGVPLDLVDRDADSVQKLQHALIKGLQSLAESSESPPELAGAIIDGLNSLRSQLPRVAQATPTAMGAQVASTPLEAIEHALAELNGTPGVTVTRLDDPKRGPSLCVVNQERDLILTLWSWETYPTTPPRAKVNVCSRKEVIELKSIADWQSGDSVAGIVNEALRMFNPID